MDEDHIPREQFLIEFFGNFGRDIGNPTAHFTDNPNDILSLIEDCRINKLPAFISVNPRTEHDKVFGIEKLFFDFDYADKTWVKHFEKRVKDPIKREKTMEERKVRLQKEVEIFLRKIEAFHIVPMVVKTRRGFHIYIYLDHVYQLGEDNEELLKEVYDQLLLPFTESMKGGYEFLDESVLQYKALCRVPLSIHQISGEECFLVKSIEGDKVTKDKLRGIDFYRQNGLKENAWLYAVMKARDKIEKEKKERLKKQEEHKENWEVEHGFVGTIRPCFQKRIESGEMCHQMRLALLIEAYWAGYKTPEAMLEVFKRFHDYNEKIATDQIAWFWKNKVEDIEKFKKWKPYRCTTIEDLNWCDLSQCPIYRRRKQRNEQKPT